MASGKPLLNFIIEPDLLRRVDNFRFKGRFATRASAIKWLLDWALTQNPRTDVPDPKNVINLAEAQRLLAEIKATGTATPEQIGHLFWFLRFQLKMEDYGDGPPIDFGSLMNWWGGRAGEYIRLIGSLPENVVDGG